MSLVMPEPVQRTGGGPLKQEEKDNRYRWLASFIEQNDGIRPKLRHIAWGWGGISLAAASECIARFEEMGWIAFAGYEANRSYDTMQLIRDDMEAQHAGHG